MGELVIQIGLDTKAARSSTIDSFGSPVAQGNDALARTEPFAGLALADHDWLEEDQRRSFHRATAQMYNASEAPCSHHQNGLGDQPVLEARMRPLLHGFEQPGIRARRENRRRVIFGPRFVAHIERRLRV